jgi:hypothetical protein
MGLDGTDLVLMTTSAQKADGKEQKGTSAELPSTYCSNFQKSQMVIYSPTPF